MEIFYLKIFTSNLEIKYLDIGKIFQSSVKRLHGAMTQQQILKRIFNPKLKTTSIKEKQTKMFKFPHFWLRHKLFEISPKKMVFGKQFLRPPTSLTKVEKLDSVSKTL